MGASRERDIQRPLSSSRLAKGEGVHTLMAHARPTLRLLALTCFSPDHWARDMLPDEEEMPRAFETLVQRLVFVTPDTASPRRLARWYLSKTIRSFASERPPNRAR